MKRNRIVNTFYRHLTDENKMVCIISNTKYPCEFIFDAYKFDLLKNYTLMAQLRKNKTDLYISTVKPDRDTSVLTVTSILFNLGYNEKINFIDGNTFNLCDDNVKRYISVDKLGDIPNVNDISEETLNSIGDAQVSRYVNKEIYEWRTIINSTANAKSFSIKKYGEEQAYLLACEAAKQLRVEAGLPSINNCKISNRMYMCIHGLTDLPLMSVNGRRIYAYTGFIDGSRILFTYKTNDDAIAALHIINTYLFNNRIWYNQLTKAEFVIKYKNMFIDLTNSDTRRYKDSDEISTFGLYDDLVRINVNTAGSSKTHNILLDVDDLALISEHKLLIYGSSVVIDDNMLRSKRSNLKDILGIKGNKPLDDNMYNLSRMNWEN